MPGHNPVQIALGEAALAGVWWFPDSLSSQPGCDSVTFFSEVLQDSPFPKNSASSAIQVRNGLTWKEGNFPNNAKSSISRPSVQWGATAFCHNTVLYEVQLKGHPATGSHWAFQLLPNSFLTLRVKPSSILISSQIYNRARKALTKHKG